MPFIRIHDLSLLPREYGLKEVRPCPTFREALQIGRDAYRVIYYFTRRGFPPLLMEKKGRILEHEYKERKCVHCGQAEPEQPTASAATQGNSDVTLLEILPPNVQNLGDGVYRVDLTAEQAEDMAAGKQLTLF